MKTIFKLLSGILLVLLSACSTQISLNTQADQVASAAARIADFQLPEGYQAEYTADLAGYTLAAYHPGDGHSHLFLVQAGEGTQIDQSKLEDLVNQQPAGRKNHQTRMTVIEQRPVSLRGQQTTLVISEGTNSDGDTYRQATAAFQGKGGPALVAISEPTTRWDSARIDQFLASIQ